MADDKTARDKQADDVERRQRVRELDEALDRADELEPHRAEQNEGDDHPDSPRTCHRRGCNEPATFLVLERYQEETGHGTVEATAALCREHTAEESPTNLDDAGSDYVFHIEPL
ncbi:MAG: hypothetical protein ACOCS7_01560 [Halolamina sp.]